MPFGCALALVIVGLAGTLIRKPRPASIVGLLLLCAGAGAISGSRFVPNPSIVGAAHSVPRCQIHGAVVDDAGGLGTLVSVHTLDCGAIVSNKGSVFLDGTGFRLGSGVTGWGTLIPLSDDSFGRARARYGAAGQLTRTDIDVAPPTSPWWRAAAYLRESLERATSEVPGEQGALLRGLTIGDVEDVSPGTLQSMKRSGLTHLVAVSGENVAIVLGVIALLVSPLSHRLRIAACAAALAMFVLVVGPEASVLRAAAMGWIGLLGLFLGRRTQPLYLVAIACLILIGIRPPLVGSVGFILSVAATIGIVLWAGTLADASRLPKAVALPVGVTAAAQIAVAPILIVSFGQISLVGLVANVLAVPAVAPATVLGFVAGGVGLVAPHIGALAAAGAAPFAGWILLVADRLGTPSWAMVEVPRWIGLAAAVPITIVAIRSIVAATGDTVST
jgi:competence protein ComEC